MVAIGSSKWTMTPSILPKLRQTGLRTTKPSQSPDLNPIENLWTDLKSVCKSKEAYQPDSVTSALSGVLGQNSPNLLWEAGGRLPETFDPS